MKNRDAYLVYLIIEGLFSLFFYIIFTVNLVYQVEVARLNPLQLVLVGTMLEATAFVFQVPTGVFASHLPYYSSHERFARVRKMFKNRGCKANVTC